MAQDHTLKITLSPKVIARMHEEIRAGRYDSESELINACLESFLEPDDAFEAWIKAEVLPTIHRNEADPGRFIPADRVHNDLQAFMARNRSKGSA